MNGKITLFINKGGMSIELIDEKSRIQFVEITLDAEATIAVLSHRGRIDCKFEVYGLENVGKIIEHDTISFEMPKDYSHKDRDKIALELATQHCPPGWEVEPYFSSRDNWKYEGSKLFCVADIVRWVEEQ